MPFQFGQRSLKNLEGVHPHLVEVMNLAIARTLVDFGVTEGLRSLERQEELFQSGKSKTMQSRHLTGHAVDVMAYVDGVGTWDDCYYSQIADVVSKAAFDLGVPLVWGGSWKNFKDLDHFELERHAYPSELVA